MAVNQLVTRFPGGSTNSPPGSVLENLKHNNPAFYHQLFNDFDSYTAADWVVTATGAATEAIAAGDGGVLLLTNTAALNDLVSLQYAGGTGAVSPTFLAEPTKDLVFACSISLDSALNASFLVGLAIADTSPIASLPASGMFISKAAASLYPQGYIRSSSSGQVTAQAQTPMADATMMDMAIVYSAFDGSCTMYLGAAGANVPSSQFRVANPPTLPVPLLAPTFALQNGTAAARTMSIDWYMAAKARRPG
jgi:hypothetical protein